MSVTRRGLSREQQGIIWQHAADADYFLRKREIWLGVVCLNGGNRSHISELLQIFHECMGILFEILSTIPTMTQEQFEINNVNFSTTLEDIKDFYEYLSEHYCYRCTFAAH